MVRLLRKADLLIKAKGLVVLLKLGNQQNILNLLLENLLKKTSSKESINRGLE
ncbi:hypothetical protein D3C87_1319290 [compost metagenome]